jgi:hypothetical protein
MAKKISQLNAITIIQEDDLLAVVEGSETKKAEVYQLENYLIVLLLIYLIQLIINLCLLD